MNGGNGTNGLLKLDQITTYYGQMRILEGISIEVGIGELVCLLGGNASGKSTTLKTILGLVRPRAGRVLLAGEDVTAWPVPQRIANGLARRGAEHGGAQAVADLERQLEPAFVPAPDAALPPLVDDRVEARGRGPGQASQRVAVEVDDVRVDHEPVPECAQRVGCVEFGRGLAAFDGGRGPRHRPRYARLRSSLLSSSEAGPSSTMLPVERT